MACRRDRAARRQPESGIFNPLRRSLGGIVDTWGVARQHMDPIIPGLWLGYCIGTEDTVNLNSLVDRLVRGAQQNYHRSSDVETGTISGDQPRPLSIAPHSRRSLDQPPETDRDGYQRYRVRNKPIAETCHRTLSGAGAMSCLAQLES